MIFDDMEKLELSGFLAKPTSGGAASLVLSDTRDAWITGCTALAGSSAFAKVLGQRTQNVLMTGCDLRETPAAVDLAKEVSKSAVRCELNILPSTR